jgi:helix-turn-helix protein
MSEVVYLRTDDAAKRISLSPNTLLKMRMRGNGPPFIRLTPRRIVYALDALDAFVRSREFTRTGEYTGTAA